MAFLKDQVCCLVKALQQADNISAIVRDDLDDLIHHALQHRRHEPARSSSARTRSCAGEEDCVPRGARSSDSQGEGGGTRVLLRGVKETLETVTCTVFLFCPFLFSVARPSTRRLSITAISHTQGTGQAQRFTPSPSMSPCSCNRLLRVLSHAWRRLGGMLYSPMRLLVLLAVACTTADAFMVNAPLSHASSHGSPLQIHLSAAATADCGCANTDGTAVVNGVSVTGGSLRSTTLVDRSGQPTPISSVIGSEGKAVVVFLRHLG